MIGQGHIDPVWLWPWTEGRAEAMATSKSAVDRLNEYPDFQFSRGESQIYQWIQEEDPALFAQIQQFIRQGRWHVVNGMVIQPDMNLPHGESFVRQVLLGKAYMQEHLGVEPRVAYCVDSFGHAGTLPQIFSKCGLDYYVFMRPGPHEKELPAQAFWWQAPDGSRVLTFRITGSYASRATVHEPQIETALSAKPESVEHTMCFFGVGNHGGGPTKVQIEDIQSIAAKREDLDVRFSTPQAYFDAIEPQGATLPTVADELQYHAVGCYSVISALKRNLRKAESNMLLAERMASLAQVWAGQAAPQERLTSLWHRLCFNQFHDTLGGSSIKEAEDEAITVLGNVAVEAYEIADTAGRAIVSRLDTSGSGGVVGVFNPFGQPFEDYVEYEPWTDGESWESGNWGLTDENGEAVPYQIIESHEALSREGRGPRRLVFPVKIPAMGYRLYRFQPNLPQEPGTGEARAEALQLENDLFTLRVDAQTGAIVSCIDKATQVEFVGPEGWNLGQVLEDKSDTWSHRIQSFDDVIGRFGDAEVSVYERGPLQASLLVERSYEGSTWLQQITVRHGSPDILIRNWLVWQGQWRMIKLAFDVAADAPQAAHDVPFGWLHRPTNGHEAATHMWMDVTGSSRSQPDQTIGAALLNDGKYGCDVRDSMMRLTVLRCPPYAYHEPHPIGFKQRYDWIDQGYQEFTVAVRPHIGDWRDSGVVQAARQLNVPRPLITMHCKPGEQRPQASLLRLSSPEMEVTALKPAEDGNGYIVRVADRHGRGGSGELSWLDGETFPITLAPFEVSTYRLANDEGGWRMTACDMLERPL